MLPLTGDLIAAIATPLGIGGVGIIRISGNSVATIIANMLSNPEKMLPNRAVYSKFLDQAKMVLDEGIAIFFKAPNSFTGEDVLEIQAHGGPVILNLLLNRIIALGARIAEPGEFTKRAFLAKKIDLVQVESMVNLINASTDQAALAASRSLQGEFSRLIHQILDHLITIRAQVEAVIDFPEDDIEVTLNLKAQLNDVIAQLDLILAQAKHGQLITTGLKACIIGKPNVGKSSLLNVLSGEEKAIVTEIPGTTRDLVRNKVNLDGLIIEFIDTAGIRSTDDMVEKIGITKAIAASQTADLIIVMIDIHDFTAVTSDENLIDLFYNLLPENLAKSNNIMLLVNKIDLVAAAPQHLKCDGKNIILISLKANQGIDLFKQHLKILCGLSLNHVESTFMANARHVQALEQVSRHLCAGINLLNFNLNNFDLLAEELRLAQLSLGKITGFFSNEDLLDKIFADFCIGK